MFDLSIPAFVSNILDFEKDVGAQATKLSTPTPGMIGCFQPGISLSFHELKVYRNITGFYGNI